MKAFGLTPSRKIGEIKRTLEEAVAAGDVAPHQESEAYVTFVTANRERFGI
jgi:poly(A) polymerase